MCGLTSQFQVTVHNKKVIVARVGAIMMLSGTKSSVPVPVQFVSSVF